MIDGWRCSCGRSWSPYTAGCVPCNEAVAAKQVFTTSSTGTNPLVVPPGVDPIILHVRLPGDPLRCSRCGGAGVLSTGDCVNGETATSDCAECSGRGVVWVPSHMVEAAA